MSSTRIRVTVACAAALALTAGFTVGSAHGAPAAHPAKAGSAAAPADSSTTTYTAAEVLAAIQQHSTSATKVNTKPHINTMTRDMNVNVYQPAQGVFSYTSSMAIDDDGSDPDPDPDHQDETTFQDSDGAQLAAHHVPFYVLGDDCWDDTSPCPHFFYEEHGISGRQFALMFYNGKVIGAIFGDTQTGNDQTTSDNDSRELGEASVKAASLLGIPSSGTTGGVDDGVTVAIFSGPSWVVDGTNSTLSGNAQSMVQNALNTLGASLDGGSTPPPPPNGTLFEAETGTLSSGGTFDSNHDGFTGTAFANTANKAGAYVQIPVTVSAAGTKTLTFRYSDGTDAARPATISVNGSSKGTLDFPVTDDWDTWSTVSISVPLKAGSNTIRVTATTSNGDGNIDSVTVS